MPLFLSSSPSSPVGQSVVFRVFCKRLQEKTEFSRELGVLNLTFSLHLILALLSSTNICIKESATGLKEQIGLTG